MKITIENTSHVVLVTAADGSPPVEARLWEGKTESGIPLQCLITAIAAEAGADLGEFERELQAMRAPTAGVEAFPDRLILTSGEAGESAPSITCPRCGATSYNPHDIEQRYCGNCHKFVDDEPADDLPHLTAEKRAALEENEQPVIAPRLGWLAVHGAVCLALRHPGMNGPSRKLLLNFAQELGEGLVQWGVLTRDELIQVQKVEHDESPHGAVN